MSRILVLEGGGLVPTRYSLCSPQSMLVTAWIGVNKIIPFPHLLAFPKIGLVIKSLKVGSQLANCGFVCVPILTQDYQPWGHWYREVCVWLHT